MGDGRLRPPPDSRLSSRYFEHGVDGVAELIAHHDRATAGAVRFVGMWHSHPDGVAAPSPTGQQGMAELLVPMQHAPRRALLLILGGPRARWSAWLDDRGEPDVFVRLLAGGWSAGAGPARARAPQRPSATGGLAGTRSGSRKHRPAGASSPDCSCGGCSGTGSGDPHHATPCYPAAHVDPHPDSPTGPSGTRAEGQEADP